MGVLPEISVILPMYNVKKYVEQCVDSILGQDFKDFEVILVDDVSTDGSLEVCESRYGRLGNVRILRHTKNMGASAARNTALWKAGGKYVTFVDSDDVLMPNALSLMHDVAVATGAEVVAGNAHFRSLEEGGSVIRPGVQLQVITPFVKDFCKEKVQMLPPLPERREAVLSAYRTLSIASYPWGKLFVRDFLIDRRIFFPEERIWPDDMLFMLPCLIRAERYAVMTEPFYIYRIHGGSITHSKKTAEHAGFLAESELHGMRYLDQYANDEFFRDVPGLHETIKEIFILRIMQERRDYFAETLKGRDMDVVVHSVLEKFRGEEVSFAQVHFRLANLLYSELLALQEENDRLRASGKG